MSVQITINQVLKRATFLKAALLMKLGSISDASVARYFKIQK